MAGIKIRNLSKTFNLSKDSVQALDRVNLDIKENSFVTIVGKSGCGKTTLLRILSGLEEKSDGEIQFISNNGEIKNPKVSVVFQEPRLMPWLTIKDNMKFSMIKLKDRKTIDEKVDYHLELLDLKKFSDAYPSQISGGMAQRVSLGRTLCYDPDIILMDEPLSALDVYNRRNLQDEIKKIFDSYKKTIVFITHDIDEAIYMGQHVVVINNGKIVKEIEIPEKLKKDMESNSFKELKSEIMNSILES